MTGLMYGIAAAITAALLAGVGWLIRDVINNRVKVGQAEAKEEAQTETRIRAESDFELGRKIDAEVDAMPDAAVTDKLRSKWKFVWPKQ